MKVVINQCYGGYGLSEEARDRYAKFTGVKTYKYGFGGKWGDTYRLINNNSVRKKDYDYIYYSTKNLGEIAKWKELKKYPCPDGNSAERNCPWLVKVVEQLGKKANGDYADLKIVEVPDNLSYTIEEYDGLEHIAEVHRTWS